MKKILLITGVHPDEKYSKLLCHEIKRLMSDGKNFFINVIEFPTSRFNSRNVELNLNREEDQDLLSEIYRILTNIYTLSNDYDLILDVHNSPNINNCILISQKNKYINLSVNNSSSREFLIHNCVTRSTNFRSISTILREDKKVLSFTIEIDGMANTLIKDDDIKFIKNCIISLSESELIDTSNNDDVLNTVLSNESILHTAILKHHIEINEILKIKQLSKYQIDSINSFEHLEMYDKYFPSDTINIIPVGFALNDDNNVILEFRIKG